MELAKDSFSTVFSRFPNRPIKSSKRENFVVG